MSDQSVSWLMFFTLSAVIVVAAGAFLYFLRSQRNRDVASEALAGDGAGRGTTPSGAMPELAGVAAIFLLAMGLLASGYNSKSKSETAAMPSPVGTVGTTGMTQGAGSADRPKPYQPANPAPDLRAAPTSSDTGSGVANGSTGTSTESTTR